MKIQSTIRSIIRKLSQSRIPVRPVTHVNSSREPSNVARGMTVEQVHSIIGAAEAGQTQNLFSLYRDMILSSSHLQNEFAKRKLAVLGDSMQFLPLDKENKDDVATAQAVETAIAGFKGWTRANAFLLDSCLYPLSVLEKVFSPKGSGYELSQLIPVPYQCLDFSTGILMIFDVDPTTGQVLSTKHEADPNRYIIHRGNLLSSPDNWGGPMRSVMFWWLLATMDREWWGKFLDRYGSPFLVGRYADEEGRSILERAFALATKLGGLAVSDETEIEIKQAATSDSGEAFEKLHSICNREISKLVLGQTLSSEAQAVGMGEGVSDLQENVRQDIRKFDGRMLAETLRDQLFTQFCLINRLPGQPPRLAFGSDSDAEMKSTIGLLKALKEGGLRVKDESLMELSAKLGLVIEREPVSSFPSPFSVQPLSARQVLPKHIDAIAAAGAADLAQAFRGSLAPIARIIRDSRSADECENRIREFCVNWKPERVSQVIEDALTAYTANGSMGRSV